MGVKGKIYTAKIDLLQYSVKVESVVTLLKYNNFKLWFFPLSHYVY